ncbi:hypothetical protein EJ07DRAFT_113503 [Lizonia empirigonia]|nr:hypothetical protein EJ07DRAFT_113503 [Lizonia empirigonia]
METADARQGSAPYGKACTNCVKAKCRCVVRDAGTCERSLSFTHGKPFLGAMIGLARPLISDLKLDRGPTSPRCPGSNPPHLVDNEESVTHTSAGRRAYISCFALSVIISTTMKYDSMRWSAQLESACRILSVHSEVEGDRILVALARFSKVALEAGDVYRQVSDDPDTTIHPVFSITPLKSSLNQTKDTLTSEQLQHIITYMYAAEAAIYELALLQPTTLLMHYCDHNLRRVEYLTGLLQTCKACIEHFLVFDLSHITAPMMIMFGYYVKLSYCLLTLQNEGWDTALARITLDPAVIFERAVAHCENVNTALTFQTGEDSIFKQAAEMMRATAPRWRVPVEQDTASLGLDSLTLGVDFAMIDLPSLEFLDDFWLTGECNF